MSTEAIIRKASYESVKDQIKDFPQTETAEWGGMFSNLS